MHRALLLVLLWPALMRAADIRLERTPCYGRCPVEVILLDDDGTAHYAGYRHVTRLGHYVAKIDRGAVASLEKRIRATGFFGWPATRGFGNIDMATLIVTVGTKTSIDPEQSWRELQNVAKLIDEVAAKLRWHPVDSGLRGAIPLLRIRSEGGEEFFVRDAFELPLLPGTYTLHRFDTKDVQRVVVREGAWTTVR